jgi:hypothetical protein
MDGTNLVVRFGCDDGVSIEDLAIRIPDIFVKACESEEGIIFSPEEERDLFCPFFLPFIEPVCRYDASTLAEQVRP